MSRTPKGMTRERVYRFVAGRILAGDPPTVREVQEAVGLSSASAAIYHLDALVEEGKLTKGAGGETRSFRLPAFSDRAPAQSRRSSPSSARALSSRATGAGRRHHASFAVPVLGRVQAGALTTAYEDVEGYISVQSRWPAEDMFALRVRGDSMSPDILEDDLVIVHRQPTADDGEIVVALVEDEATVKKLSVRRGRVELCAVNPEYAPIVPRAEDLVVLGKVVELRRSIESAPGFSHRAGFPHRAGSARRAGFPASR